MTAAVASLEESIARLAAIEAQPSAAGAVSFQATASADPRGFAAWRAHIDNLVDILWQRACAYAVVTTPSIAVTRVGWTGDCTTVWSGGLTPELAALHQTQVAVTLSWQITLMRSAVAAIRAVWAVSLAWAHPVLWPGAIRSGAHLIAELEKLVALA